MLYCRCGHREPKSPNQCCSASHLPDPLPLVRKAAAMVTGDRMELEDLGGDGDNSDNYDNEG